MFELSKNVSNTEAGRSIKYHRTFKRRPGFGVSAWMTEALAVEEPLEIRLGGRRFTLTMRTPGHDQELAAGFLLAEGFVTSAEELGEVRCVRNGRGEYEPNGIDVILNVPAVGLRGRLKRNFVISSSCGVCGKTSIESIQRRTSVLRSTVTVSAPEMLSLPHLMHEAQKVFNATGGLHAAALFRPAAPSRPLHYLTNPGESEKLPLLEARALGVRSSAVSLQLAILREDVGRHNAVDKVIGHALLQEWLPLSDAVMMVSGRLSFEIVQKAAAAGIPILAAVSAPSSLAVELAQELGMTLVGFVREANFNIYTSPERITGL